MRHRIIFSALLITTYFAMAWSTPAWSTLALATSASSTKGAQEISQTEYTPSQDNLVYLNTDAGLVVIELAPFLAPKHVSQFKALVDEGFYNGLDFYRVIDGFVAQGGDITEKKPSKYRGELNAEFVRPLTQMSDFIVVQSPEFLAEQTGFIQGFPAGRSNTDKQEWLLHCPGAVAMARNNEADSGSTDFYIVIGHAPRHLDRNMSVFAQVIYGMQNVQAMQRGNANVAGGVIENEAKRSKILQATLGHKMPKNAQLAFTRSTVSSASFQERLTSARSLSSEFFHHKGTGNLDVCYYRPRFIIAEEMK